MIHRLATRLLCTGTVLLVLAPAAEAGDWKAKWSNGHKVESEDGNFKLKFGGRIQADYTFASADGAGEDVIEGDGFEFRRARLFFSGTIYKKVEFKAQYDFAGGDADFKDVWIGLKTSAGKLQFGHFKEHFGLEEQTSSKYLAFLERSLPTEAFSPSRNSGVGLSDKRGDKLNWGIGYYYDADGFGVSTDENNTNITGRIGFRPFYEEKGKRMVHVGVAATVKGRDSSIRFRARPGAHLSGRFVDTKSFAADGATILGLELAAVSNRFWFAGEYMTADVDAPSVGDPSFDGYYAQAGYFLTDDYRRFKTSSGGFDRLKPSTIWGVDGRGAWEIVFRAASIDLSDQGIDGGEQDNLDFGVNWYLNPATRLMFNYVTADAGSRGDADFFLVRWQVDF